MRVCNLRTKAPVGFIWLLITVSFVAGVVHSENDTCLARRTLIAMSGTNEEPPKGLMAADFRVTVGGKAASVQSATPADHPPRVMVLIDASANQDQSTWAATEGLVDEFLAGFPGVADLTVITFDDKVVQVVHETDRGALQGRLGEMFPSGKRESDAGLGDAIKKANDSFGEPRGGDAEFLVTTSDQVSKETVQALSQQRAAGVRLFGASFDQSTHPAPLPSDVYMTVESYSLLGAAAKASGGLWVWFDKSRQDATASAQNARAAGKRAATVVRNYYILDLQLAKPLTKPEKLKIELAKSPRGDVKDSSFYPQDIFPCQ
jgi:hypothetical protein